MIEKGKQVSIEYTLFLDDGSKVDTNVGSDPLSFTFGEPGILPALQDALAGLNVGDSKRVTLSADQGYGPTRPDAFHEVDAENIPEDARVADTLLIAEDPDGNQQQIRVHEVKEDKIVLDFNHPLAGQALTFDVKILAIA